MPSKTASKPPHQPASVGRIPRHIAIIMDGNGRWARQRGLARAEGHAKGGENLLRIIEAVGDLGIEFLTVYAFSVENWRRPAEEIGALMHLLEKYLTQYTETLIEKQIRLRVIGDISALPAQTRQSLEIAIRDTANFTNQTLVLALNYGARAEVLRAARELAAEAAAGRLDPEKLSWETFAAHLDTDGIPDPDLVIRTSGETRLSNFLLLQAAYAEWYFTPVLWPDFDAACLAEAVNAFANRERRFGMTGEQLLAA
jgi:undecaprenyl diphosphate synthase